MKTDNYMNGKSIRYYFHIDLFDKSNFLKYRITWKIEKKPKFFPNRTYIEPLIIIFNHC